ncbi:MAG: ATP-binding cassette domain-containing protein [Bacillota bacterium]
MIDRRLLEEKIEILEKKYPYSADFFAAMALDPPQRAAMKLTVREYFNSLDHVALAQKGIEKAALDSQFLLFMNSMRKRQKSKAWKIQSVTIVGGYDKTGRPENIRLELHPGDVVSIVGPTGSGKSRLLGDVEWLAQGDTPTKRIILIDHKDPPMEWRFSLEHKLVAQLSQNMNFVMDLSVAEFIRMHGESRMIGDVNEKIKLIIEQANLLAGEPVEAEMPVTALSGGQSRALMIADTAFLSTSPIVLIDEIENAGIDRKTAVDLLIRREKIVLIATHDPVLALRGDRRIVIRNGGIAKIHRTTEREKERLADLEELNARLMHYRELLRRGEEIL